MNSLKIHTIPVGAMRVNCYLLRDSSGVGAIIDPGGEIPQNGSDLILKRCRELSVEVKMILLTHAHFDHMLSLERVRDALGAPLYLHPADFPALADPYLSYMSQYGIFTPLRPAEKALADGDILTLGESRLRVIHTPGHTPGSICLLGDELLISGDTLFCGSIGRCDLVGGDELAMTRSLKRLKELDGDLTIYPGHGPKTTLDREREANPYLK